MQKISLSLIEPNPQRIEAEPDIETLVSSFSSRGQLAPIILRPHPKKPGHYQIVFGNRRFAAATKLGWQSIQAEVLNVSDREALEIAFTENSDRVDFTDYERALILEKLRELTGKSYSEIGKIVGRSPAYISQHLAMLRLFPESIASEQERARLLNRITERHARVLARIEDPVERWNNAKLSINSNMSERELHRFISRSRTNRGSCGTAESAKSTIRDLIDSIGEGLNRGDARPLFDVMSEKHYSLFDDFPPFHKMNGTVAREHIMDMFLGVDDLELKFNDIEVRVYKNFAFATMYVSYKLKAGGKKLSIRSRGTWIFAKEDGFWKIVHSHWSPADPINLLAFPFKHNRFAVAPKGRLFPRLSR